MNMYKDVHTGCETAKNKTQSKCQLIEKQMNKMCFIPMTKHYKAIHAKKNYKPLMNFGSTVLTVK